MEILAASLKLDQLLSHLNELTLVNKHFRDDRIMRRFDVVLHLHRLNSDQGVSGFYMLSNLHEDLRYSAWHGALNVVLGSSMSYFFFNQLISFHSLK